MDLASRPAWARRLMWGGVLSALTGLTLVIVFVQIIAWDDAPENVSGPSAITKIRAYQDRQQFYGAMKETGNALILASIAFTFAAFVMGRNAPSPTPRILPTLPLSTTAPVAAPPPTPSDSESSPRDILRKIRKG